MRWWVYWRRFLQGKGRRYQRVAELDVQIEAIVLRADPEATWEDRANWLVDWAEWLGKEQDDVATEEGCRIRTQRLIHFLDWLDAHPQQRGAIGSLMRRTLDESSPSELFSATGIPKETAFMSELVERLLKYVIPRAYESFDLSTLFTAMFPQPHDAAWLQSLDQKTLMRIWQLCAGESTARQMVRQIGESLTYLMSVILALGISPNFRRRLDPVGVLEESPFVKLRQVLDAYLQDMQSEQPSENALYDLRRTIAASQTQIDRIYSHLDQYGVSVGMVYSIERMRAQLVRMGRLIDMLASQQGQEVAQVQLLLADLIVVHHQRASIRGLVQRSFSLLARKMVERNADHGEHYIARDGVQYRQMLVSALRGGVVTAFTAMVKLAMYGSGLARFFDGVALSLNYAFSFMLITAVGGTLATKQPAVTAPALAAKMEALDTREGVRALVLEIRHILRSQAGAVFGNILAVAPMVLVLTLVWWFVSGKSYVSQTMAHHMVESVSIWGPTPFYAALTGVLLWLSSLTAGFADNWFALRRIHSAVANQRRLHYIFGKQRTHRLADWLEHNIAGIVGNVSIGFYLGMTPVVAEFFGLSLDVRHVTLQTGALVSAMVTLGWSVFATWSFWMAVLGLISVGIINVGVAFACALLLALRARDVPRRSRELVFRKVRRKFLKAPILFFLPDKKEGTENADDDDEVDEASDRRRR